MCNYEPSFTAPFSADQPLLAVLAETIPRFVLSVCCVDAPTAAIEESIRRIGASFTSYAHVDALRAGGLHDCILVGHEAERVLVNERDLSGIRTHLSSTGIVIAVLPEMYVASLPTDLEGALGGAGFVLLRTVPLGMAQAAFIFARQTYDPLAHARQLGEAGMPGRAAAVLDWLEWCVPLKEEQRAAIALEKLRYFRQAIEAAGNSPGHGLLFHAQKEFHIAVHKWPRRPRAYLDQAAIWRRYGNDDYAARLLRSLEYAAPDESVRNAIEGLRPELTRQPPHEIAPEWNGTKPGLRVLILTHDFSDYGMDTLYDGLCQVLGPENVVEWPWKPTLHGRSKEMTVNYPCWFDYPGEPRSLDTLLDELRKGKFGLIVFADFVQMDKQEAILRMLDAAPDVPVVVYDPWDDGSASQELACAYLGGRAVRAYFKREMLACLDYGPNAYPLPFSYPDRHVPWTLPLHRTTDVFWAGKRMFGTRTLYLDYLHAQLGRALDQKLSQERYRRAILEARIGLSFFGFGFDTVRYWELAAHGCMILAERPLVRIPFNFVEGESAVFFDDLPELERKLAYYLAHPEEAERIGRAGRELFLRYHTSSARARQFLGRIEELLLWGGEQACCRREEPGA